MPKTIEEYRKFLQELEYSLSAADDCYSQPWLDDITEFLKEDESGR